jgi:hypothetical protein
LAALGVKEEGETSLAPTSDVSASAHGPMIRRPRGRATGPREDRREVTILRVGAEAWEYWVPYDADVGEALRKLRQEVFRSGRYRGSEANPATPEEAFERMGADGTASILDITHVSDEPDFCAVRPLSEEELDRYFGTKRPTREDVENNLEFFDGIERGQGVYTVVYANNKSSAIFFGGYSFD